MMSQPKQVFTAFRASMLDKTDAWQNMLADDVTLTGPLAQVKGKAAFIEVNLPFFASIQDSELYEIVESGDYIITQIRTDCAMPSGNTISLQVCEWYGIKDGKVSSLRVYFDTAEFLQNLSPPE